MNMPLFTPQIQNQLPGAIFPFVFYPIKPPKSVSMDSGQSIHSLEAYSPKGRSKIIILLHFILSYYILFLFILFYLFVSNQSGIDKVKFITFYLFLFIFWFKSPNHSLMSASSPEQPDIQTFFASSMFPPHTISFHLLLSKKLQNMLHFCSAGILKCWFRRWTCG